MFINGPFSKVHLIRGAFHSYAPRGPELCPYGVSFTRMHPENRNSVHTPQFVNVIWGTFCCYEPQGDKNLPLNGPFSYVRGPFYSYTPSGVKLCP